MSRIAERFAALRERGEKALVPFVTAGDPDLETTEALVLAMAEAGADVIEIGVPFSDPTADGPTIQRASERALRAGATLRRVLELVEAAARPGADVPAGADGLREPVPTPWGPRRFAAAARRGGRRRRHHRRTCRPRRARPSSRRAEAAGIDAILLAAPTTTRERLEMLRRADARLPLLRVAHGGHERARRARRAASRRPWRARASSPGVPVCVGFGISTPRARAARSGRIRRRRRGGQRDRRPHRGGRLANAVERLGRFVAAIEAVAGWSSTRRAASPRSPA